MPFPPSDKSLEGLLKDVWTRLGIVEHRLGNTLPDRLTDTGELTTDWDTAYRSGFYYGIDAAHGPTPRDGSSTGVWMSGIVTWHNADGGAQRIIQTVRQNKTNYTQFEFTRYFNGTSWTAWTVNHHGVLTGTAALRAATISDYWDFWQDTDGSAALYVGNKTGGWRRFSGQATSGTTAWDATVAGPPATAGRTIVFTLPTVLETNETVLVTANAIGSGYGFIAMNTVTRNASDTTINVRFMQIMSVTTQAVTINWQIVQQ